VNQRKIVDALCSEGHGEAVSLTLFSGWVCRPTAIPPAPLPSDVAAKLAKLAEFEALAARAAEWERGIDADDFPLGPTDSIAVRLAALHRPAEEA
jgi:hypothetical protein